MINEKSSSLIYNIKTFTKTSLSKELQGILDPIQFFVEFIQERNIKLIETNNNSSIKLILIYNLNNKISTYNS